MIETLIPDQIDQIRPLFRQVQALHARHLPDRFRKNWDEESALTALRKAICEGEAVCLAERGATGNPRGFLIYKLQNQPETAFTHPERIGLLDVIAVGTGYRRQGIGLRLVEAMKEDLRERDVRYWTVTHHAFNTASAALMARAGAVPSVMVLRGAL